MAQAKKNIRSINELRNSLYEEAQNISENKGDHKKARTIAQLAHNIVSSYKLQLMAMKQMGIKLNSKNKLDGLL